MSRIFIHLLITLWYTQLIKGLNFTQIESPTGAFIVKYQDTYISYNDWKLIYCFELKDISENFKNYQSCLVKMENLCNKIKEKDQCGTLLQMHKNTLLDINSDIQYLEDIQNENLYEGLQKISISRPYRKIRTNSHKKKRAILGFVGSYIL